MWAVINNIAQSTALREEIGEVEYEKQRDEHDEAVQEFVQSEDAGAVVKSTGDGVLAVFSEPSTAVERCLDLQRALATHRYFKLRIGLDMGQVSVKSRGGIVRDVFGRHVNRAARIQALSEPGHILTSFTVYDCAMNWLKHKSVNWLNHGKAYLKGFADSVSIHEVFDPTYCTPQSNRAFPPPPESTPRAWLSVGDVKKPAPRALDAEECEQMLDLDLRKRVPVLLTGEKWNELHEALHKNPIIVQPLRSTVSSEPITEYTKRLRSRLEELTKSLPESPALLWVDDHPENNQIEQQVLRNAGFQIDLANSTDEAVDRLRNRKYLTVITDMKRGDNHIAGTDLLRFLNDQNLWMPRFVYTSAWGIGRYGEEAMEAGASLATAGIITLLDGINQALNGFLDRVPFATVETQPWSTDPTPLTLWQRLRRLF